MARIKLSDIKVFLFVLITVFGITFGKKLLLIS